MINKYGNYNKLSIYPVYLYELSIYLYIIYIYILVLYHRNGLKNDNYIVVFHVDFKYIDAFPLYLVVWEIIMGYLDILNFAILAPKVKVTYNI